MDEKLFAVADEGQAGIEVEVQQLVAEPDLLLLLVVALDEHRLAHTQAAVGRVVVREQARIRVVVDRVLGDPIGVELRAIVVREVVVGVVAPEELPIQVEGFEGQCDVLGQFHQALGHVVFVEVQVAIVVVDRERPGRVDRALVAVRALADDAEARLGISVCIKTVAVALTRRNPAKLRIQIRLADQAAVPVLHTPLCTHFHRGIDGRRQLVEIELQCLGRKRQHNPHPDAGGQA